MLHLPDLIRDLALILIAAGVMTLLCKAIRQPVVLGYIIAGFLIGPNVAWVPGVVDNESVKVWAEIGVIFLLFALGLEFSFKKLARVGGPASITAIIEVVGMVATGYLIGQILGWGRMDCLFLGGILAISSTTIIIRAFDELGMKTRGFAKLVFGVLIIEDLVAILLMVLLATVAATRSFSGTAMAASAAKLGFFLILWFVLGIFLVPSFLKRTRHLLGKETLLVVSIGLCFLMVVAATKAGFSPALGAFIMGSILAETVEGERIDHLIHPVKDLFAAVFFVSVGMLIDPRIIVEYAVPILVITLATIVGKFMTTTIGALASGQTLRHSVQSGFSLAQIGEFSFIIAGLGISLKVTSGFLYPIAISVSAITTFTTPYLIRSADGMVAYLERTLPKTWLVMLENFQSASANAVFSTDWERYLRRSSLKFVLNAVLVIGIFLLVSELAQPQIASLILALVLSAPFIWALGFVRLGGDAEKRLWAEPQLQAPLMAFQAARWIGAIILLAVLSGRYVSAGTVGVGVGLCVLAAVVLLRGRLARIYHWFEERFVSNLHEKEIASRARALPPLAPWNAHLVSVQVSPDSSFVGKKLSEAKIREMYGIIITLIERGSRFIAAPNRDEVLFPFDTLQVIGTDEQIARFRTECERGANEMPDRRDLDYVLQPVAIDGNSPYAGKSILECGVREASHGLIVGIERSGSRELNPDASTMIEPGNVLWIVGDRKLLKNLGQA